MLYRVWSKKKGLLLLLGFAALLTLILLALRALAPYLA